MATLASMARISGSNENVLRAQKKAKLNKQLAEEQVRFQTRGLGADVLLEIQAELLSLKEKDNA